MSKIGVSQTETCDYNLISTIEKQVCRLINSGINGMEFIIDLEIPLSLPGNNGIKVHFGFKICIRYKKRGGV